MSTKPRSSDAEYLANDENDPVSSALDRLDTKRYSVEQGVIRPINTNQKMTFEEWAAIMYLVDEWTFFYEPESDLFAAAVEFEPQKSAEEEVYTWEG